MSIEFNSKSEARAYFSKLRASIITEERNAKSLAICKKIAALPDFSLCDTLFIYSPIKNEADPTPLFEMSKARNIKIAFPISVKESLELDFRIVNSIDELTVGAYGIREPQQNAKKATFTKNSICIVPALAFDNSGNRLGYGKGFYDRFLKNFTGLSIGITFDELKCTSLPYEITDVPVDIIITDKESVKTK